MNAGNSQQELIEESIGTGAQSSPHLPNESPEKITGYKPVTIRAKENTAWFFDRIIENERAHRLSTADSFSKAVNELRDEQGSTSALAAEIEALKSKAADLEEENKKLLVLTETNSSAGPVLKDNEQIIEIDPQVLQLLNSIAKKRFENTAVRNRYKLNSPETAGELLLNCIRTEEIMFDHNGCFYTGLTKAQLAEFKKGRA